MNMRSRALLAVSVGLITSAGAAAAQSTNPDGNSVRTRLMRLLDNEYYKIDLNIRARMELADFKDLDFSQAYTVRTEAGIGSKPLYGLSGYASLQNVYSPASGEYFDTVEQPTGQSPIADPEETDLLQLYARYQNAELLGLDAIVGRQRVNLDDQRFIGSIGWRQTEQVLDALRLSTTLGIEHFSLMYGYIDYVSRIFGNEGPPAMRDYHSDSHMVHAAYTGAPQATVAAFIYLLDFDNSPVNSSNSFGLRVAGNAPLSDEWTANYFGSYAIQIDGGDNPVNYTAHYVAAEGGLAYAGVGGFAVGYELLGSDDGEARFVTPLATAHKFNGWADVFLDNGGPDGLQDLYASVSPALPFGVKGSGIYHHFWSDQGGTSLGDEIDAILLRPIGQYLTVLTKVAYFDGSVPTLADRWRYWLEVTFKY